MEIKILGSGSSGNAYKIDDGGAPLLLEAGIRYKELQRGLDFKVSSLAGCLISHSHLDHCKSAKDLIKAGVDVYMPQATKDALGLTGHRVHVINERSLFNIGLWVVRPFDVRHDVGALGFLLAHQSGEKICYITDSMYSPYTFTGVTRWLIEVNYDTETIKQNVAENVIDREHYKRVIRSHCSLETAVELLKANDLSKTVEIIAIHLSNENANEERIKTTLQQTTGKPVYIA